MKCSVSFLKSALCTYAYFSALTLHFESICAHSNITSEPFQLQDFTTYRTVFNPLIENYSIFTFYR